jgi:chromosome segregation ATPase
LRIVREQLTSLRERALTAEQEQKRLQDELAIVAKQKESMCENIQKVHHLNIISIIFIIFHILQLNENQASLQKKLKAKDEEVRELRQRIKELEKEFTRANQQYDKRVEEIRRLKIKVQDLTNENRLIALDLNCRDDNRVQIFRLQRDLTDEQLKRRALEDELAQPRNIHRWRQLQVKTAVFLFKFIQRTQTRTILCKHRFKTRVRMRRGTIGACADS